MSAIALMRAGAAMQLGARRRAGGGAPVPVTLDLFSGGTFTRSSEGSYLIGAPTDGSTAFLAWALANVRRIEDRGDGLGDMLLVEGARTNIVAASRNTAGAGWTASATRTLDVGAGPDAAAEADRNVNASGSFGSYVSLGSTLSGRYAMSFYGRRMPSAGADEAHFALQNGAGGTGVYVSAPISETWERFGASHTLALAATFHIPWEGRALGGLTTRALDYLADLHQVEAGHWPTSPIRTAGAAVTRAADVLSYAVGEYPSSFLTDGFTFTFAPDFSSAELIASAVQQRVLATDSRNYLTLNASGGAAQIQQVVANAGGKGLLSGLVWSRGQVLTITCEPSLGRITVSGATAGDGSNTGASTPGGWGEAGGSTLYVGAAHNGSVPVFGRFGQQIESL